MAKIFDNIETKFEEGLHAILTNVGVERADFCVYEVPGSVDHAGILKVGDTAFKSSEKAMKGKELR